MGEQGVEIGLGAVGDPERGATALETFDGGTAGGAAGTEQNDVGAGEFEAEGFADGRGQAVAIGVVSAPAGWRVQECVDGADGAGDGFDRGDAVNREDFVRDREVEAVEIFRVEEIEGAREVIGMNLEAKVTPVGKPGVATANEARAALCMAGLIECLIGWPSTARAVPGKDQPSRSARLHVGSDGAIQTAWGLGLGGESKKRGPPIRPDSPEERNWATDGGRSWAGEIPGWWSPTSAEQSNPIARKAGGRRFPLGWRSA